MSHVLSKRSNINVCLMQKSFYCFIIHMYERWEIRGWKSNKVVKKSRSEDNSSSYHLVLVYVLFKNIIMPINKRYQVVRNWKSKATCENMFTTSTSCVISLDVSVKWDYPMHQNKIEGKTQILFIVFMLERFCAWNDWHANLTSFFSYL